MGAGVDAPHLATERVRGPDVAGTNSERREPCRVDVDPCVIVFVRGSILAIPRFGSPPRSMSTTQTPPAPAAMLVAVTAVTRATRLLVRGSIRETVRSGLITQTASRVTAMCCCWAKPPKWKL